MPGSHATLSPSSAERWISCPASIRASKEVPCPPSSPYAQEGTIAHALADLKGRLAFGQVLHADYERERAAWREDNGVNEETELEMEVHVDAYVALVQERFARYPDTHVRFERRLDTGVPDSWGTTDCTLFSPIHVEIIDFKYGAGVAVEAAGNPQLRLYGLGALLEYGDVLGDTEEVYTTVHQPRMEHTLTEVLTPEALYHWRDTVVIPAAKLTESPDAPFGPSEAACRWCPVSGRCAAQLEHVTQQDFGSSPDLLSPADMAEVLGQLPQIKEWLKAFEEAALTMAYQEGVPIPGHKVVTSGGQRKITDPEKAAQRLKELGYDEDEFTTTTTKMNGIGKLEKLLKPAKHTLEGAIGDALGRTPGQPSLVPESDKREPISSLGEAQKDFAEEE